MALFDHYEPSGSFACPVCGSLLGGWQGYEGPCALLVFRQGFAGASDQRVDDECRLSAVKLAAMALPDEFHISAYDCACPYPTELRCTSIAGVWQSSELFTGTSADRELRGPERREQWQARRQWLDSRKHDLNES